MVRISKILPYIGTAVVAFVLGRTLQVVDSEVISVDIASSEDCSLHEFQVTQRVDSDGQRHKYRSLDKGWFRLRLNHGDGTRTIYYLTLMGKSTTE